MNNVYLCHAIPLLFGVPSVKASNRAIFVSIVVLMLSFYAYLLADIWSSFPFFHIISTLLMTHLATALITTQANLLYLFRYSLVWVLIFAAAIVFSLYGGDVLLNWFGVRHQTIENTRTLLLAGIFSLCGSLIGWHTSLKKIQNQKMPSYILNLVERKKLRRIGFLLAYIFAALYVWKVGGVVGDGQSYVSREEGFALEFGVFNIFHFIGIALLLLSSIAAGGIQARWIFLAILSLLPGMMAGSRADFLPQIFILLILIANNKIAKNLIVKNYWIFAYYFSCVALLLATAYMGASFIAIWRSEEMGVLDIFQLVLERSSGFLIQEIRGVNVIFLETGNMMLGGLYSAIVQVREDITGLLFGESYFNYFISTPPAFLGLPRPLGLEWATDINGEIMTQGGIFEVAESYWNFGVVGCFTVSFCLSYFFAWLLRQGVLRNNYFFLVWYFVFGIHSFRSIWYQNFSYFRLMTVMLVILSLSHLFFRWFSINRIENVR